MAKLPAIIDLISKHDTRSVATISNYARVLRDHGLLPKGKRGRGAPDIRPLEVADLVLGLAGASDAVDAPQAASALREATLSEGGMLNGEVTDIREELKAWSICNATLTFGEAMSSLLVDEPFRTYPDGKSFGVTNLDVRISEVPRDRGFGFAELYLTDGSSRVTLNFTSPASSAPPLDHSPLSWSRSTLIDLQFFYDASRCLLGISDAAQGLDIDPAPD